MKKMKEGFFDEAVVTTVRSKLIGLQEQAPSSKFFSVCCRI